MKHQELQSVPLYAFATAMEFSKVFPEDANSISSELLDVPSSHLYPLKRQRGFACVLGVGILDFSASLAAILHYCVQSNIKISAVINVGICGAYPDSGLSLLDVVRVESDCVGDLGCEESDGSVSLWGKAVEGSSIDQSISEIYSVLSGLKVVSGATVNCCTGTSLTAQIRSCQLKCDVESMEGAACFSVCKKFNIPAFQVRAVSNIASTRNKSLWKVDQALEKLRILLA